MDSGPDTSAPQSPAYYESTCLRRPPTPPLQIKPDIRTIYDTYGSGLGIRSVFFRGFSMPSEKYNTCVYAGIGK